MLRSSLKEILLCRVVRIMVCLVIFYRNASFCVALLFIKKRKKRMRSLKKRLAMLMRNYTPRRESEKKKGKKKNSGVSYERKRRIIKE